MFALPLTVSSPGRSNKIKRIVLLSFVALLFVHLGLTFAGFYNGDDIYFARYAADVAHHGIPAKPTTDHFQLRWTPIYVTAIFYSLFGINAFTSSLFSSACIVLCALLLHKIYKNEDVYTYFLGMATFFFARSTVFYSHRLLADEGVALSVLWMYFVYRNRSENGNMIVAGTSFAAAFLFGIISKETIAIALPLFLCLFVRDVVKKKRLSFWKTSIPISLFGVLLYLLYFKITTGDFLFRYHLLMERSYMNICSFDKLPFSYTIQRIGYQLWNAMLLNGDMLVLLQAFCGVVYSKRLRYTNLQMMDAFAFLMLICCANFMTISPTSYVPLCHDPRHFIFVIPFAAICGGRMMYAYFKQPLRYIALPAVFVLATGVMFILRAGSTKYIYLLASFVLLGTCLLSQFKTATLLFYSSITAFCATLFINYCMDFIKPLYPYYWDHKRLIEGIASGSERPITIFSDSFSTEMGEYFLNFNNSKIKFRPADSIRNYNSGELYYLFDRNVLIPPPNCVDSALQRFSGGVSIYSQSGNITLYKVNNEFLRLIRTR